MAAEQTGNKQGGGRAALIRHCNDALRRDGEGGTVVMTAGIAALPPEVRRAVLAAVRAFEAFNAENDPHGEHDLAIVPVEAQRVIFKVDYYDRSLRYASPDPANPAVTTRVLTIMLAEEY